MTSGSKLGNLKKLGQVEGQRGESKEKVINSAINGDNYEIGVCVNVEKSESERKPTSYNVIPNAISQCSDGISV